MLLRFSNSVIGLWIEGRWILGREFNRADLAAGEEGYSGAEVGRSLKVATSAVNQAGNSERGVLSSGICKLLGNQCPLFPRPDKSGETLPATCRSGARSATERTLQP